MAEPDIGLPYAAGAGNSEVATGQRRIKDARLVHVQNDNRKCPMTVRRTRHIQSSASSGTCVYFWIWIWTLCLTYRIGEAGIPGPCISSFDSPEDPFMEEFSMEDCGMYHLVSDDAPPDEAVTEMTEDLMTPAFKLPPIPAKTFSGVREGYVFTTRGGLTGYFHDSPAVHGDALCSIQEACPLDYLDVSRNIHQSASGRFGDCGSELEGRPRFPLPLHLLLGYSVTPIPGRSKRQRTRVRIRSHCNKRGSIAGPVQFPEHARVTGISRTDRSHLQLGLWAIDSANSNTIESGLAYLQFSNADVVAFQESRVAGDSARSAERRAKHLKWNLAIHDGVCTEAGSFSAGVAVAVRQHVGHSNPPNLPWHDGMDSRVRVSWISALCKGRLFVISLYLWHSEGLSQRNLDILQHVAWLVGKLHGPWIIAADWNMSPGTLKASGWLNLVGGGICSPGVATCHASEYDFFVICRGLQQSVVGVFRINDAGFGPHSPVRI